jgi:hypothetical protein
MSEAKGWEQLESYGVLDKFVKQLDEAEAKVRAFLNNNN